MLESASYFTGYKRLLSVIFICVIVASCASQTHEAKHNGIGATPQDLPLSKSGNPSSYVVFGKTYHLLPTTEGYKETGIASWYGDKFHGKRTSSGDTYDMHAYTAAHKTLPIPSFVTVTNLENNRTITVLVNDRGPFVKGRIIDLSYAAAKFLGVDQKGTAPVLVQALAPHQYLDPSKKVAQTRKIASSKLAQSYTNETDVINRVTVITPEAQNNSDIEASLEAPFSDLETLANTAQHSHSQDMKNMNMTQHTPANVVVIEQQFFDSAPLPTYQSNNSASATPQYHIQLGSFSSESNARNFQKNMIKQLPYPVQLQYHQGFYKVYVGHYHHEEEAKNIASTLPVKSTISYF